MYLVVNVPVVEGGALGRHVLVLRDTGSTNVIIRRGLVTDDLLKRRMRKISLVDGSVKHLPAANIQMDTPYLVGEVTLLSMTNPTYDLVLDNLPGLRAQHNPDSCWVHRSCKTGK
ncbi:hypothetical protein HPB48_007131 [Haemaphysalis longicornis]|uniref:Uncharacterized protein n=1 Tax=Haemaphysalis longicornis TaxID=44386 RepID=A0A9J6GVD7_HAELO|nr:hypothetical protein HPB48_007131 [Haemaphysalis longicornis]